MSAEADAPEIPAYVLESLQQFHSALTGVEEKLDEHFFKVDFEQHMQREPLEQARVDLMAAYTANSLLWMYLCTKGEDPSENEQLKSEMGRIKTYMDRLKQLEDRVLRPAVNRQVARNFVRNALFDPATSGNTDAPAVEQTSDDTGGMTVIKSDPNPTPGDNTNEASVLPAAVEEPQSSSVAAKRKHPKTTVQKRGPVQVAPAAPTKDEWSAVVDQELSRARNKATKRKKLNR